MFINLKYEMFSNFIIYFDDDRNRLIRYINVNVNE